MLRRPRPRATRLVASAALAVLGLATVLQAPAAGSTDVELALQFDDVVATGVAPALVTAPQSSGTAAVVTSVVTANQGFVSAVPGLVTGTAARFPQFNPLYTGQRAVVSVTSVVDPVTGVDPLTPGERNFSWGAKFTLDAVSASKSDGSTDNGDNLLQRGLASNASQFKLELDAHQPACRLAGSLGNLRVVLSKVVTPGVWYQATCSRTGSTLTTSLAQLDSTGAVVQSWSRTATLAGGFGAVVWAVPSVPLSVGGKLNNNGTLVQVASDQFNGVIDDVFVDLG